MCNALGGRDQETVYHCNETDIIDKLHLICFSRVDFMRISKQFQPIMCIQFECSEQHLMDIFIVFLSVIQCRVYIRFTIIKSMLALFCHRLLGLLKITYTCYLMLCGWPFEHAYSLKYFFAVMLIHPRILPAPNPINHTSL